MLNKSPLKPHAKPKNPKFSTGPTSKYPNYNINNLNTSLLGRNHRSLVASNALKEIVIKLKTLLSIPNDYKVIITPGSDTGAMEIALWNLLGANKVDLISFEHFGYMWQEDLENQLKVPNLRIFKAPYGDFPNISQVDFANNDVIFPYCGTTSGVVFNQEHLIPEKRNGLIICDATSYVFSEHIHWQKFDALTFSWQKCLGGEAQNGILILSPAAIARINNYMPKWPIPYLFRIKNNNKIKESLLDTGSPINTISMLCVIDFLNILTWCEEQGGLNFTIAKVKENYQVIKNWVENSPYVKFLPKDTKFSSKMSLCLEIYHNEYMKKTSEEKIILLAKIHEYLENNNIAYDINSHIKAPAGLRIWAGATIDKEDLKLLTLWLDYCFDKFLLGK